MFKCWEYIYYIKYGGCVQLLYCRDIFVKLEIDSSSILSCAAAMQILSTMTKLTIQNPLNQSIPL